MQPTEIVLQANLCNSCGNLWFTPNFKIEGEQSTCPFCQSVLFAKGDPVDISTPTDQMSIPNEIQDLLSTKTSQPMLEKVCVFCKNFILVAKEDDQKAAHCPYCSDKLEHVSENSSPINQSTQPHANIIMLDDIQMRPVMIKLKDTRRGIFKLIQKPQKPISAIFIGVCPISKLLKIISKDELCIKWIALSDIENITEILLDNPDLDDNHQA